MGGDYYTSEYDYTTVDGSQPETPTETAENGQVPFSLPFDQIPTLLLSYHVQPPYSQSAVERLVWPRSRPPTWNPYCELKTPGDDQDLLLCFLGANSASVGFK